MGKDCHGTGRLFAKEKEMMLLARETRIGITIFV